MINTTYPTMRLQGIGMVLASQAKEIRPGDTLMWNFGEKSKVDDIIHETPKFITIKCGKFERRLKKDRAVCNLRINSMTKRELNIDVKRLLKAHRERRREFQKGNVDKGWEIEKEIQSEIRRLYYADTKLEYISKNNLLIMLRLNLRYRAITLHHFGNAIDL